MAEIGTQTNGPKDKKVDDYALDFTSDVSRKGESELASVARIVLMHEHKNSRTMLRKAKKY